MASEVFRNKFYKHYEDGASVAEMIQLNDLAYFYELDDIPTNWPGPKTQKRSMLIFNHEVYDEPDADSPETETLLVPVFHKKRKPSRYSHDDTLSLFAVPFFITVSRGEANDYTTIVEKIVEKYQLLTTHPFYEDAPGDREDTEEDSTEEIVKPAVELKDKVDDEKDGFVEVSMKDAVSSVESEDAEIPDKSRCLPADFHNLFTLKISKKKEADRVPTGWSGLEADIDMLSRLRSSANASPIPQKHSAVSSLASAGNSGRRSPVSDISDEDNDIFENTEERGEPTENLMQDLSDDEEANYSNTEMLAIPTSDFYNSNSNASSTQAFKLASSYPSSPTPPNGDYGPLVRFGEAIIVEWTDPGYDAIFGSASQDDDFRGAPTWKEIPVFDDPELARARLRRDEKKRRGIHLEDCLDEFAKEEVLSAEDPWYCPRCKEHRRATKKFELWKCPDILVIHLKRFSSSRSFRDKIDVQIECPIEGLDLEKRVGNTEDKGQIYDLIGVDNHYGGLGGGHYTAYVKNWFDKKWYYCDGKRSSYLPNALALIESK
jgi:ubiquitin carboxyl-terminal hydrolase 4/11/15